jgi:hypothetical protein
MGWYMLTPKQDWPKRIRGKKKARYLHYIRTILVWKPIPRNGRHIVAIIYNRRTRGFTYLNNRHVAYQVMIELAEW